MMQGYLGTQGYLGVQSYLVVEEGCKALPEDEQRGGHHVPERRELLGCFYYSLRFSVRGQVSSRTID